MMLARFLRTSFVPPSRHLSSVTNGKAENSAKPIFAMFREESHFFTILGSAMFVTSLVVHKAGSLD